LLNYKYTHYHTLNRLVSIIYDNVHICYAGSSQIMKGDSRVPSFTL